MKFTSKTSWGDIDYTGRSKGFIFEYTTTGNGDYYCVVNHSKKDIRFNSLWEEIVFPTEKEAQEWCENWDYKKHKCLGNDID
jgi:hypothetical protein